MVTKPSSRRSDIDALPVIADDSNLIAIIIHSYVLNELARIIRGKASIEVQPFRSEGKAVVP